MPARRGFVRVRVNGEVRELDEEIKLEKYRLHTIEVVVDRLRASADANDGGRKRQADAERAIARPASDVG